MANSVVELVNISLGMIGVDFITSIEDNRKAAIVAKKMYPEVRDAVLRGFTWNCATKRVFLAPTSTAPTFDEYSYKFALPADCLRVVSLYNDEEYILEGRRILANSDSIGLEYIYRLEDPSQFDSLLTQAIQARLASVLAIPLTDDKNHQASMWEMYKDFLREAKGIDSREKSTEEMSADVWIEASRSGSSRFRSNR